MSKDELLEELYLRLLHQGPGFNTNIEFWDPTEEAIELYEKISSSIMEVEINGFEFKNR